MKVAKIVGSIISLVMVYLGFSTYQKDHQPQNLIVSAIFALLFLFLVYKIIKPGKKKEKPINNPASTSVDSPVQTAYGKHINGLPIAENTQCTLNSYPQKIEIQASGTTFNLKRDKITDICLQTETEIQKQYVSSVGGAGGGADLFGPLGAMIGGRAKEKKSRTVSTYFIITYASENGIQYIGFDVTNNYAKAGKIVDEFKKSNLNSGHTVDL